MMRIATDAMSHSLPVMLTVAESAAMSHSLNVLMPTVESFLAEVTLRCLDLAHEMKVFQHHPTDAAEVSHLHLTAVIRTKQ